MKKQIESKFLTTILLVLFIVSLNSIALAGPGNIANLAKVSASAELNSNYAADNIIDGLISISDIGEWALSQMAIKMGKKKDAKHFLNRSSGWKKTFQ